jgi:hypothetical protein
MLRLSPDSGIQAVVLARGVKCLVALEIRAEGLHSPGGGARSATKKNQPLDAELRGRHADLARKLASSGYL